MITLTESAARHLQALLDEKGAAGTPAGERPLGLRIFVEKGGCSGMEYSMKFDRPEASDLVVERAGVRVFIDEKSTGYLEGATIDYQDGLTGAGFRIQNPNAARTCGCGSSFEPAAAAAASAR